VTQQFTQRMNGARVVVDNQESRLVFACIECVQMGNERRDGSVRGLA
jgi:hypothetical protein